MEKNTASTLGAGESEDSARVTSHGDSSPPGFPSRESEDSSPAPKTEAADVDRDRDHESLTAAVTRIHQNLALHYDTGKLPLSMVPPEFIEDMAKHYEVSTRKYKKNNWRNGFKWSKLEDSARRHLNAYAKGEMIDPDGGQPHLIAAVWNIWTLHWCITNGKGEDDRS